MSQLPGHDQNPGQRPDSDHWLVRPKTIRLLWWLFGVLLSVLLELYFRPRRKRLLDRLLSEFDPSDLSNAGIYSA